MAIALFGQLHDAWLRTFPELPNGIPSHNTPGRVFARLDAIGVEEGFRDWVQGVFALTDRQVVLIEGPRTRAGHDAHHMAIPSASPTTFCGRTALQGGYRQPAAGGGLELGQSAPAGWDQAHTAKMQSPWKGIPRNQNILAVWVQADPKLKLSLEASEGNSFNETALGKEEGQENRQCNQ